MLDEDRSEGGSEGEEEQEEQEEGRRGEDGRRRSSHTYMYLRCQG